MSESTGLIPPYPPNDAGPRTESINPQEIAALAGGQSDMPTQSIDPPPSRKRHRKRDTERESYMHMIMWSVGALLIFLLIGTLVMLYYNNRRQEIAAKQSACEQAIASMQTEQTAYQQLIEGDAATVAATSTQDVADSNTISALKTQIETAQPQQVRCNVTSVEEFDDRINALGEQTQWYNDHQKSVSKAMQTVQASVKQKQLNDAKQQLNTVIDTANAALSNTQDSVLDQATWDELAQLITQAKLTVSGNDQAQIQAMQDTLNASIERVEQSHEDKLAEEERIRQAQIAEEQRKRAEAIQKAAQQEAAQRKAQEEAKKQQEAQAKQRATEAARQAQKQQQNKP